MRNLVATIVLLAPTVGTAEAYQALNQLQVIPLDTTTFEVIESRGEGPRGIWCAASDYAIAQGVPDTARIYILRGRGSAESGAGRKSIVFTTDETRLPHGARQSMSLGVSQVGAGLPVYHAHRFCEDYFLERFPSD